MITFAVYKPWILLLSLASGIFEATTAQPCPFTPARVFLSFVSNQHRLLRHAAVLHGPKRNNRNDLLPINEYGVGA